MKKPKCAEIMRLDLGKTDEEDHTYYPQSSVGGGHERKQEYIGRRVALLVLCGRPVVSCFPFLKGSHQYFTEDIWETRLASAIGKQETLDQWYNDDHEEDQDC